MQKLGWDKDEICQNRPTIQEIQAKQINWPLFNEIVQRNELVYQRNAFGVITKNDQYARPMQKKKEISTKTYKIRQK